MRSMIEELGYGNICARDDGSATWQAIKPT